MATQKKTDNKLKFKDNPNNLLGHGGGVGMKINEGGGNLKFSDPKFGIGTGMTVNEGKSKKTDGKIDGGKPGRDDKWKEDLRTAYDTAAANQIKASDESYAQAKSDADRHAQSRGMGRSSYNNATLANLDAKKVEAQNDIRANVDAAYQQAVLNQQNVYDQLDLQQAQMDFDQQQAAQEQANWQAQFAYQQAQDQIAQQNWQNQFAYQQQQADLAQQNWQAQFDAQQAQQAWQNAYDQDVFKYTYQNGGAAAASGGSGSSGSSGSSPTPGSKPTQNPGNTTNPWAGFVSGLDEDPKKPLAKPTAATTAAIQAVSSLLGSGLSSKPTNQMDQTDPGRPGGTYGSNTQTPNIWAGLAEYEAQKKRQNDPRLNKVR